MLVRYTMEAFTNRAGFLDVKALPGTDGPWVRHEDLEAAVARALEEYCTRILNGLETIG